MDEAADGQNGHGGTGCEHPVQAALAIIQRELGKLVDQELWDLQPKDCGAMLLDGTSAVASLGELVGRVAAHASSEQVGLDEGATSTENWWAHHTRQTRLATNRQMRLGQSLARHEPTRQALAHGSIVTEQADVIARAVDDLSDLPEITDAMRTRAEAWLLEQAQHHDAKDLRILSKRLIEVAAPDQADAREAEALANQEREAEAAASFSMSNDGEGKCHGRFTIPEYEAAVLKKALLAIAAPKHQNSLDPEQRVAYTMPSTHRLGRAFMEYLSRYRTEDLPGAGGVNATVVVTMDFDALESGLKGAQLDTGERLSPGLARRLACEAGLIPAVLDGQSQVLDLGRTRRFHSKAQRIALGIEQGGCTAESCDWPPGMCHAHHDNPWSTGGSTDLKSGRLLCPKHHHLIHDPAYETTHLPTGKVAFHRRT